MIKFDFEKFSIEKRISRVKLSKLIKVTYQAVCLMWKRESLKPETLAEIEKKLKMDLSDYIINK